MARDPRCVHPDLLAEAIEQARPLLRYPIDRAEIRGSLIRVDAAAVDEDNPVIADTSEDLARTLASALADAKGGTLANGPIARDK